ncbi:50S ribosomal protein L21, partial [Candidatus Saccharibacteria bacterium]|nr:50S ribosomal protein L21 [Candidatus Saccharibacteria bacterium]
MSKVRVKAEIIEQTRDDKILVFKYKPKKGYRRKRGHKQHLTKVRIEDISFPGKPAKPKTREVPEVKPKETKKPPAKKKAKTKAKAKVKAKVKAKA